MFRKIRLELPKLTMGVILGGILTIAFWAALVVLFYWLRAA